MLNSRLACASAALPARPLRARQGRELWLLGVVSLDSTAVQHAGPPPAEGQGGLLTATSVMSLLHNTTSAGPRPLVGHVSPYLRAHAADPVRWQLWGKRAFTLARETPAVAAISADSGVAESQITKSPARPEATSSARKPGRLLFVSVGYFACHWCHVMQRESFEDGAIAKLLNGNAIAIKGDREFRPELDAHSIDFVKRPLAEQVGH